MNWQSFWSRLFDGWSWRGGGKKEILPEPKNNNYRNNKVDGGGKSSEKGELAVSWWNGGGKMVARLEVNPELGKFLATKPDVFVYGESLVYKHTQRVGIPGYKTIIHTAKRNECRRGMVASTLRSIYRP